MYSKFLTISLKVNVTCITELLVQFVWDSISVMVSLTYFVVQRLQMNKTQVFKLVTSFSMVSDKSLWEILKKSQSNNSV